MTDNVWESEYLDVYDTVLLNSEIYLAVRDFHVSAMKGHHTVLDSCCGTGNATVELLKNNHIVYATEQSKKSQSILRKKCAQCSSKLPIISTGTKQLENETFDGISSMFVIYYINNPGEYLKENYRLLKPGGILALTGRISNQDMELILNSYENSLKEKGLLPELEQEFSIFKTKFLNNVTKAVINSHTFGEMKKILKNIGFKNIQEFPNPYLGQCYSLIAHK